ncbi:hypothetical protein Tco_0741014 [Tanacetum coccineum]
MQELEHNVTHDTIEIFHDDTVETIRDDADIVSLGSIKIDEVIEDVLFDPESMPDDEIEWISGDDSEADFDTETTTIDKVVANALLNEIMDEANTWFSTNNVFAQPTPKVLPVSDPKPVHVLRMIDLQELVYK